METRAGRRVEELEGRVADEDCALVEECEDGIQALLVELCWVAMLPMR